MSALATLSDGRVRLRRWRDQDREAFAAINSDPRVMEFFRGRLSRVESDAMVDDIEKHFGQFGFGLWAVEVPGVAPFIGFAGLSYARLRAHFTPCVEVGWRLAHEHWGHGYATEAPTGAWPRVWDSRVAGSRVLHICDEPAFARGYGTSWDAAAIPMRISIILGCRKVIRCKDMCSTGSIPVDFSARDLSDCDTSH
jgi:hypothetical protein